MHFDIRCKILTKVPMGHTFVGLLEGVLDGKRDITGPVDGCLLVIEIFWKIVWRGEMMAD